MHREYSVTELPFLHFELTQAHNVRLFFVVFFSPTPSVVFLEAIKKCEIPRRKPLDGSLTKTELFKEVDKNGGGENGVTDRERERERDRERKRHRERTTHRETEECYDLHHVVTDILKVLLLLLLWYRACSQSGGHLPPPLDWRVYNSAVCQLRLTNRLPLSGVENFRIIYFLDAYIFYSSLNSRDSFLWSPCLYRCNILFVNP